MPDVGGPHPAVLPNRFSLDADPSLCFKGSSDTSHTSRYFGSIDSSENNHGAAVKAEADGTEHLLKYVLQDPVWLLMADTDDSVRMTYQMPARNLETVLQEDREKLKALQRFQPRFTDGQKQELQDIHPWMRSGGLPTAIDVEGCVYCENEGEDSLCVAYEEDTPTPGLSEMTDTKGEESGPPRVPETKGRCSPPPQGDSAASDEAAERPQESPDRPAWAYWLRGLSRGMAQAATTSPRVAGLRAEEQRSRACPAFVFVFGSYQILSSPGAAFSLNYLVRLDVFETYQVEITACAYFISKTSFSKRFTLNDNPTGSCDHVHHGNYTSSETRHRPLWVCCIIRASFSDQDGQRVSENVLLVIPFLGLGPPSPAVTTTFGTQRVLVLCWHSPGVSSGPEEPAPPPG
ncbi:PER2 [Cervus elaphus hippelaphus]|uniref:PER2 n=1 Tax=Cervus elaphus hippelaphus TaxID=46360 RepID=A0A212CGE6_CEREH|nr:PER2 [Cervus elaphus hippelaphus]